MIDLSPGKGSLDDVLRDKGVLSLRDPRRISQMKPMLLGSSGLHVCEVHDVMAYANSYVVKGAGLPHMIACLVSLGASFLPMGGRECSMIMPGSLVLCYISETLPFALIVGVLPTIVGGPNLGLPDCITPAGHSGFFVDAAHNSDLNQKSGHGFLDFSVGRPVDGLPGDWGFLNELGVGLHIGKLRAFLRAGEFCKFETHYEDQLARIAGYNLEVFTAGSEEQAYNDEGEWTRVSGFTSYPWEAAGAGDGAKPFIKEDQKPIGDNKKFGVEPKEEKQAPLWRFRTWDGFLGDMRRNMVISPTKDMKGTIMEFEREETPYYGLLDERYGFDGSYRLKSAKSISLEKTVFIPVPYEKLPRDNKDGDNDLKDAAGKGADYVMEDIPEPDSPSQNAICVPDSQAYADQHLTQEGFNIRKKDWGIQDPPKMPNDWEKAEEMIKPFSEFEMDFPESGTLELDHRGERRYYKSKAFVHILDDGGIVLKDAYGSSITLTGGNIELTCPGSVIMRPGRDVLTMAGQDIIMKAHKDVDITSAKGSVRMKAELNFMILGGNDGEKGGVLIENRASKKPDFEAAGKDSNVGGLILKSAAGDTVIYGKNVFMQSLSGDVTIDANESKNKVIVYANEFNRYLKGGSVEAIVRDGAEDTADANISYCSMDSSGFSVVGTVTRISGSAFHLMPRDPNNKGGIQLLHYGSGLVRGTYGTTVGFPMKPTIKDNDAKIIMQPVMDHVAKRITDVNEDAKDTSKEKYSEETYYLNDVNLKIGVNFRLSSDLEIGDDFVIYQSAWQKAFSLSDESDIFEESEVSAFTSRLGVPQGTKTMPYPGKEAWADEDHFSKRDKFVYVDESTDGIMPKDRKAGAYDSAELPEFTKKPLKGSYVVNKQRE